MSEKLVRQDEPTSSKGFGQREETLFYGEYFQYARRKGNMREKEVFAGQFSQCPVYTACAFQLEFCKINVMQWIDFKAEKEYNEVVKTRNKKIGRRV